MARFAKLFEIDSEEAPYGIKMEIDNGGVLMGLTLSFDDEGKRDAAFVDYDDEGAAKAYNSLSKSLEEFIDKNFEEED